MMRMDRPRTVSEPTDAGDFEPGDTIKADYQGKSFVLQRVAHSDEAGPRPVQRA